MTTVIFVRHAESESNVFIHTDRNDPELSNKINALGDPKLSDLGAKQAQTVGEYLAKQLVGKEVRVLTSRFTRCIQTSRPFCECFSGNTEFVKHIDLLQEYTSPAKNLTPEHKSNGIMHHSTWDDFTKNVSVFVKLLENLAQDNAKPIVVFGHSLFLSVMLSYLGSVKRFMPEKSQLCFRLPNCSITTFEYSQDVWKIFNVASVAHLPKSLTTGTECSFGDNPFGDTSFGDVSKDAIYASKMEVDEIATKWRNSQGQLHRTNGPAMVFHGGSKCWLQNGEYHRPDGPAIESACGKKLWYRHGKLHRPDGPAVIFPDKGSQWFQNGIPCDEHGNPVVAPMFDYRFILE